MNPDFWHQRWRDNQIGFHQPQVNPVLVKFFSRTGAAPGDKVLVPLCGKSLDMPWLQQQGHQVLGIELSSIAVADFFKEQGRQACTTRVGDYESSRSGDIEILCGDFFGLTREETGEIAAVYDRAALIALPPEMRQAYINKLAELVPTGVNMLLITIEYPAGEMQGPPFSVSEDELQTLCSNQFTISLLGTHDVLAAESRFRERGLTAMQDKFYLLQRR